MSWKTRDNQVGLRNDIANGLKEFGVPAEQAEQQATSEALKLRGNPPGEYDVDIGYTVIRVTVRGEP